MINKDDSLQLGGSAMVGDTQVSAQPVPLLIQAGAGLPEGVPINAHIVAYDKQGYMLRYNNETGKFERVMHYKDCIIPALAGLAAGYLLSKVL